MHARSTHYIIKFRTGADRKRRREPEHQGQWRPAVRLAGDVVDARSLQTWLIDLLECGAPRTDAILFSLVLISARTSIAAATRAGGIMGLGKPPGAQEFAHDAGPMAFVSRFDQFARTLW